MNDAASASKCRHSAIFANAPVLCFPSQVDNKIMEGEEERWEDYEDINVSLTESLGHYAQTPSPSDVESLEFKFPSKGEGAFIAEEEDFGPDTEPEPPDYSEVGSPRIPILIQTTQ